MPLPTAPAVSGSRARLSTFGKMAASSSHFAGSAAVRAPLDGQLRDLASMFLAAGGLLNMGWRPPLVMMDSMTTSATANVYNTSSAMTCMDRLPRTFSR